MSWDGNPKSPTQEICHLSFINGHLSFVRCEPLACAVVIEALRIQAAILLDEAGNLVQKE